MHKHVSKAPPRNIVDGLGRATEPISGIFSASLSGFMATEMIASACQSALEHCRTDKAKEGLVLLRERAFALRRDLNGLAEQDRLATFSRAAHTEDAGTRGHVPLLRHIRTQLFASEVPLTTAATCHAVLDLALCTLDRTGIKGIAKIGSAAALAFSGVVGGVLVARSLVVDVEEESDIVSEIRERADRILREAEQLRARVMDRVARFLP